MAEHQGPFRLKSMCRVLRVLRVLRHGYYASDSRSSILEAEMCL